MMLNYLKKKRVWIQKHVNHKKGELNLSVIKETIYHYYVVQTNYSYNENKSKERIKHTDYEDYDYDSDESSAKSTKRKSKNQKVNRLKF